MSPQPTGERPSVAAGDGDRLGIRCETVGDGESLDRLQRVPRYVADTVACLPVADQDAPPRPLDELGPVLGFPEQDPARHRDSDGAAVDRRRIERRRVPLVDPHHALECVGAGVVPAHDPVHAVLVADRDRGDRGVADQDVDPQRRPVVVRHRERLRERDAPHRSRAELGGLAPHRDHVRGWVGDRGPRRAIHDVAAGIARRHQQRHDGDQRQRGGASHDVGQVRSRSLGKLRFGGRLKSNAPASGEACASRSVIAGSRCSSSMKRSTLENS